MNAFFQRTYFANAFFRLAKIIAGFCVLGVFAPAGFAQGVGQSIVSPAKPHVAVNVFVESRNQSNAERRATDELSERQDEAGVNLVSEYQSPSLNYQGAYTLRRTQFSEDSEPDETSWNGQSEVRLGSFIIGPHLVATHDIGRVLNNIDDARRITNTSERQVATVNPGYSFKLTRGTQLGLDYTFTDVTFDDIPTNDSTRNALQASLSRRISLVDVYSVGLTQTRIAFESRPDLDYDITRGFFGFTRQESPIALNLRLGLDRIDFDDPTRDNTTNALVFMQADYNRRGNRFSLAASNETTDTSRGSSNLQSGFSENLVASENNLNNQDQIEQSDIRIEYGSENFCGRCRFSTSVAWQQEDYLNLDAQDETSILSTVFFQYTISSNLTIEARYRRSDIEFDNDTERDFEEERYQVRLKYRYRYWLTEVFAEEEERQGGILGTFDNRIFGVKLSASVF